MWGIDRRAWITGAAAAMALLWPTGAGATGGVTSAGPTKIKIFYQHPGYTAAPKSSWQNKRYKVCLGNLLVSLTCDYTDSLTFLWVGQNGSVEVGKTYRIKVSCYCKGSGKFAIRHVVEVLDLQHKQTLSADPVAPQVVRFRSVPSGLCLAADNGRLRSAVCAPVPAQRFGVETVPAAGATQVRHLASNSCIYGSKPNTLEVRLGLCGIVGTQIWVMNAVNGAIRLNIGNTQADISTPLKPSTPGPGGCVRPSSQAGVEAVKMECAWGWHVEDAFHMDPA